MNLNIKLYDYFQYSNKSARYWNLITKILKIKNTPKFRWVRQSCVNPGSSEENIDCNIHMAEKKKYEWFWT
jgi:hypothetical protein